MKEDISLRQFVSKAIEVAYDYSSDNIWGKGYIFQVVGRVLERTVEEFEELESEEKTADETTPSRNKHHHRRHGRGNGRADKRQPKPDKTNTPKVYVSSFQGT